MRPCALCVSSYLALCKWKECCYTTAMIMCNFTLIKAWQEGSFYLYDCCIAWVGSFLISLLFTSQDYTTGPTCNQCKPNNFHLDASNQFGCIQCFCSGVTGQCLSSNWYRQQVLVPSFTRGTQSFKLVEALRPKEAITDGLRVDPNTRELVFQDFSRNSPGVSALYL